MALGPECLESSRCDGATLPTSVGSPGIVLDDEIVLRASYERHYQKNKKPQPVVQPEFIRKSELRTGNLSIWRLLHLADPAPEQVRAHMQAINANELLREVFGVSAGVLRAIVLEDGCTRCLCVVDDTMCCADPVMHHCAHAAVATCDRSEEIDLKYRQMALYNTFRNADWRA